MDLLKKLLKDLRGLSHYYLFSKWMLRLFVLIYILLVYTKRFMDPSVTSEYFWLAIVYTVFAILLFIGGFSENSDLTRFSALILLIASVIHLVASVLVYQKVDEVAASKLLFLGIVLYFLTSSKRQERPQKKHTSMEGIFDESQDISE